MKKILGILGLLLFVCLATSLINPQFLQAYNIQNVVRWSALFGILSIIRLRSDELGHTEIAYYFGALALGLFAGLGGSLTWATPVMTAAILAALYVGDHPELFPQYRNQIVNLDSAYTDETALVMRLESLLNARVRKVTVRKVDLVNDTTSVDVRYALPRADAASQPSATALTASGGQR